MIHWLWLIPAFVSGTFLGALVLGICAAAATDGAYREGYERGRDVGRREGIEAAAEYEVHAILGEEAA